MKKLKLTTVFIPEKEGGFTVIAEELPGAISYGKTLEEARENILEAIELVLETNRELAEQELKKQKINKKPMSSLFNKIQKRRTSLNKTPKENILDLLAMPEVADIDFEPPKLQLCTKLAQ